MTHEQQVTNLAHAYAYAVGILSGSIRVLLEHGDSYSEKEKKALLTEALKEANRVINEA